MTGNRTVARIAAIALAAFAAQTVSACRPMYGSTTIGTTTNSELAAVSIAPIPGRVGQRIRNELIYHFTGGGEPAMPKYKLEISYRESTMGILYKRTDDASGKVYSLDAEYTLKTLDSKRELTKGRSHSRAGFDKNESTFSNTRAEVDAENRAARDIAVDINTKLAAFIATYR